MTKDELIIKLRNVMNCWHYGTRPGNDGNQGNTLEDLLGVEENNISLPDLGGIFELKTKRKESKSLTTLLHLEPTYPDNAVTKLLLALGWKHKQAGNGYPMDELSFRSTTRGNGFTTRGFSLFADVKKLEFVFEPSKVKVDEIDKTGSYSNYGEWLNDISSRTLSYKELLPIGYDMKVLAQRIKEKLDNTVYVLCSTNIDEQGKKMFCYNEAFILKNFRIDRLVDLFNDGDLVLDFDARTRHNHGTKIRVNTNKITNLFEESEYINFS